MRLSATLALMLFVAALLSAGPHDHASRSAEPTDCAACMVRHSPGVSPSPVALPVPQSFERIAERAFNSIELARGCLSFAPKHGPPAFS